MCSSTTRCVLLSLLLCFGGGPAWGEEAAEGAGVPLKERVEAYWQSRVDRTPEVMRFYAPVEKGGPKRSRDVSEFGNVRYHGFEVTEIQEEGNAATVRLSIRPDLSSLPLPEEFRKRLETRDIEEKWLRIDEVWYKKPIPRGFAKPADPDAAAPAVPEQPAPPSAESAAAPQ